jgi:hypothetical protein
MGGRSVQQRIPASLWFRLLGKGKVQSQAILQRRGFCCWRKPTVRYGKGLANANDEVAALPSDNPYRQNALDLLGNLKVILEASSRIVSRLAVEYRVLGSIAKRTGGNRVQES